MNRLHGKLCLVTGAAQGIGRETATRFASEGGEVLAVDIAQQRLTELVAGQPKIRPRALDVCEPRQVAELIQREGPFDVVVNCVGIVHHGSILDCDEQAWRRSFEVNVDSMYRICRAVLPGMLAKHSGSIINIASVASSISGVPQRFAYGATKGAVIALTKSIATDFARTGVRCNAICPGTVHTPSLVERVHALAGDYEANWRSFVDRQPMGRLGSPAEIAALAAYLAADESAFTTGAIHIIDGGWKA